MKDKNKVLFGLNVDAVDNSVAEMAFVHEKLLMDLQQELDELLEETKALEMDVAGLEEEHSMKAPRFESIYHANMTMPLTISWLQNQGEEEIRKIEKKFTLQKTESEREIEQLTKTIDNGKKFMSSLIHQFSAAIENFDQLDQLKASFTNVVPFQFPMEGLNEASPAEETESVLPEMGGSNYWDGVDSFLTPTLRGTTFPHEGNGRIFEELADEQIHPTKEQNVNHQEKPDEDTKMLEEAEKPTSVADIYRESPAINQELESIKKRYIVGKVAGSDLFDTNGMLIVAEQTEITGEIVEKANRAGVLADLIVHMKIPDLSEAFE